jgi:hypothetical protein
MSDSRTNISQINLPAPALVDDVNKLVEQFEQWEHPVALAGIMNHEAWAWVARLLNIEHPSVRTRNLVIAELSRRKKNGKHNN